MPFLGEWPNILWQSTVKEKQSYLTAPGSTDTIVMLNFMKCMLGRRTTWWLLCSLVLQDGTYFSPQFSVIICWATLLKKARRYHIHKWEKQGMPMMDLVKFIRGSRPTCRTQCSLVLWDNIFFSSVSSLEPGWASLQKKAAQCDTLNCPKQGVALDGPAAVHEEPNTTSLRKSKKCLAKQFFVHMKSCSE